MDTIDLGHGLIMTLAQDQISDALSKAQAAVRVAEKNDRNPHLRNQFANLESVIAAGREAMAANGLSLTCHPVSSDGRAGVVYVLAHASGQWRRGELLHRVAANKGLNPAQADGVCVTYSRRYCLQSLLAIPTGEGDTDGATQTAPDRRRAPQRAPQRAPAKRSPTPAPAESAAPKVQTTAPIWRAFQASIAQNIGKHSDRGAYDVIKAWRASLGRCKPSELTETQLRDLIAWLERDAGGLTGFSRVIEWAESDAGRAALAA
tara:strand:- start:95 stop:880 length:786 start_codon:yes stop_codon:yes gene_type:complete